MNLTCTEVAATALGGPARKQGAEILYRCPCHNDRNPSLRINKEKNCWLCGPCGKSGNAWELAAFLAGLDPNDKPGITDWLREHGLLNGTDDRKKIIATYDYTDTDDKLLYQKVRYEPKDFRLRRSDGKCGWVYNLKGVKPVLYNLPEMSKAKSDLLVEGEKDVETARKLGLVATTSGGTGSWRLEFAEMFHGKRVAIIADADEPGRRHAREVARSLVDFAESARLLEMPGAKDLTEWVEKGGTRENLLEVIKETPILTAADVAAWKVQVGGKADATPPGVLLSEVEPEKVEWLWQNRIPLGKITILDGDPDLGKSLLTLDIAARITTKRPMENDATAIDGGVVLLTAEDGLADTVVPRLIAAGANRSRILSLRYTPETEGEKTVSNIPVDIPTIQAAIERVGAKLVIVDVLFAYLPSQTNTYRDQDIRRALAPLAQLADRMGVAVICIRHLNKASGGNPLYRGGASIGIIGVARAGLLVARDPDNPELMVLARLKGNLGPPMPSLSYRIEANSDGVPYIAWQGESQHTAGSLLAEAMGDAEERGALGEAKEFLQQELEHGPVKQAELKAAWRKAGIADAAVRRAKPILGVRSEKKGVGKDGYWVWGLPEKPKGAHSQNMSTLGKNSGSGTGLTSEKSDAYPKVPKDAHSKDAQIGMSTLGEAQFLPLEEAEFEEGTL